MLKYLRRAKPSFFTHISTFSILLAMVVTGCNSGEKAPDVSAIKVTLDTRRFDRDLAAIDTNKVAEGLQQLKTKYPDYLDFYLDTLMGFGLKGQYSDTADAIKKGMRVYLTFKDFKGLLDTVGRHFPDVNASNEQLTKGFQYLLNYFPNYKVPKVIYSVFWLKKLPAFIETNGNIGINLDMYLGPHYPYYKSVGVQDFVIKQLEPSYIPVSVFSLVSDDIYPYHTEGRTLLDMMIQRGKMQYFLSKVLPFVGDTTRLAYTAEDLKGCEQNRVQIYNFFVSNKLFYETNIQNTYRYVNDGPNTEEIAKQCPGNIGSWLGYQIVKAYMKEHPNTTLQQLMQDTDPQKFLQESKYNPR